jgi:hypothetical protein
VTDGNKELLPSDYHIPFFLKAKIDFALLARDKKTFSKLRLQYPSSLVLLAAGPRDIEKILKSAQQLKAVFYISNRGKNLHMLRFNHIVHIYIGHTQNDLSLKATKFFRAYDEIWLHGEKAIDNFKKTGFNTGHLRFINIAAENSFLNKLINFK